MVVFIREFQIPMILNGMMIHQIVKDIHPIKAGDDIEFAVKGKSQSKRDYKIVLRGYKCESIQDIGIRWIHKEPILGVGRPKGRADNTWRIRKVRIDGVQWHTVFHKELARNNGFKETDRFFQHYGKGIKGHIVHFTKMRYEFERM